MMCFQMTYHLLGLDDVKKMVCGAYLREMNYNGLFFYHYSEDMCKIHTNRQQKYPNSNMIIFLLIIFCRFLFIIEFICTIFCK